MRHFRIAFSVASALLLLPLMVAITTAHVSKSATPAGDTDLALLSRFQAIPIHVGDVSPLPDRAVTNTAVVDLALHTDYVAGSYVVAADIPSEPPVRPRQRERKSEPAGLSTVVVTNLGTGRSVVVRPVCYRPGAIEAVHIDTPTECPAPP